jgi:hypothetical protein
MPMLRLMALAGRIELLAHQRPAATVAQDLLVGHAVALADGLSRKVHGLMVLLRSALSGMRGAAARMCGTMMRLHGAAVRRRGAMMFGRRAVRAGRPAVARAGPRHRREWRRRRRLGQGLHCRRSGLAGTGRLSRCRRLVRNRRLRGQGRSENPERQNCAEKDGKLHHILPSPPARLAPGRPVTRIDGPATTNRCSAPSFSRAVARSAANVAVGLGWICRLSTSGIGPRR